MDEAHFTLSGSVNMRTCVIWSETNPHATFARPQHDVKVTVWCGFMANFDIGTLFFEEPSASGPETCTVIVARYNTMLTPHVIPMLQQRNVINTTVFMQDEAPLHIGNQGKLVLQEHFQDRIISRHFPCECPSRSPDLTPANFWLCGYLKSCMYRGNHGRIPDLNAIVREVASLPDEMHNAAIMSIVTQMQFILDHGGAHIGHYIRDHAWDIKKGEGW
ncbi:hypothetical protein EOD39_10479 [Acipenser ruthenus]|uniref:Transposable element Tc3 transposase n=1 Tax=Acipenser ruthenus TaxID=7906 RepID=A0A662YTS5_ACIRT|nr:hypothetical protein EOD39_10479 [Acipenser ruthenus]